MMDLLVKDLDKEMTDKEAAKADMQGSLEESMEDEKSTKQEHMANEKYIQELHAECDWLLQYFDVRKQARADEIDSLGKARAVLSGADFALLQQRASLSRSRKFLRHA